MSRSYQHHPHAIVGDKSFKKIYNRRFRRTQKDTDFPQYNAYKRFSNSYDIVDYKWRTSFEDFQEWYAGASQEEIYSMWKKARSK